MKYSEQLLTPEWKEKRLIILKRDKYSCVKCGSSHNLQVHHKLYERGKMAWQAENKNLITVCKPCHEEIHKNRHISTFYKQPKKNKKKANPAKKKKTYGLSEKDLKLQRMYDERARKIKEANLPEPKQYERLKNPKRKKGKNRK